MTSLFNKWPNYSEKELHAVAKILLDGNVNYWTGEECKKFEKEFANWVGSEYAVSLANGSAALETSLRSLDVGVDDEVIVTPRTFIASVSSIVNVGAIPVFADVERNSQNISADTIKQVLSDRTKCIICVHLAGWPCDMDSILEVARENNLSVIEDCAQAHGALYKGQSVGTFGDIGAWSFCQDKIMSTGGEGGMVTTNDESLWSQMWSYKDHGKDFDTVYNQKHSPGFRWLHNSFGTNWRMTEIQGAIGRIQIERLKTEWHQIRLRNARAIWECSSNFSALRVPEIPADIEHAAYKCYVFVKPEALKDGWSRDRIMNEIMAEGVPCYSGSCSEVYLEKAFDNTGWRPKNRLPVARELGETSLMFLVHPTLTKAEIDKTLAAIEKVMTQCSIN